MNIAVTDVSLPSSLSKSCLPAHDLNSSQIKAFGSEILGQLEERGQVRFSIDLSRVIPEKFLADLVESFSSPLFYRGTKPIIAHVKPLPGKDPHSFQGSHEFDLHTDLSWMEERLTPRYATLLCLNSDPAGGGESLFAHIDKILDLMTPFDKKLLQDTQLRWRSHRDAEQYSERSGSILTERDGKHYVRFRSDLIVDTSPIFEVASRFFNTAMSIAERFTLQRGDCWIVDNQRTLHGRTALNSGLSSTRELLRIHSATFP